MKSERKIDIEVVTPVLQTWQNDPFTTNNKQQTTNKQQQTNNKQNISYLSQYFLKVPFRSNILPNIIYYTP